MAFSYFGYNFVYLAAKDTGLGGGVEDIVFFLYRVCHIEGAALVVGPGVPMGSYGFFRVSQIPGVGC